VNPADADLLQRWRGVGSLAWMVLLLAWESFAPFFHAFASPAERARHALRNLAVGWINALMTGLLFAWAWRAVAGFVEDRGFGLLHWADPPPAIRWVAAILLFDLWTYLWHRAGHSMPGLWRFHRMHHSDPSMDVTSANRFHLVEILISSLLRLPLIAILGLRFPEVVVYETLLQAVVQLQHANVRLPWWIERPMRLVLVTPDMHKVHHSREQPETDSNFASLSSVWDRLFGTYRLRPDPENIRLGLDGMDGPEFQRWRGLWRTPFRGP
jgi:sterol desaturase/sphingolipid hydroxylase (fatty acid hydroxylase superfamily)